MKYKKWLNQITSNLDWYFERANKKEEYEGEKLFVEELLNDDHIATVDSTRPRKFLTEEERRKQVTSFRISKDVEELVDLRRDNKLCFCTERPR